MDNKFYSLDERNDVIALKEQSPNNIIVSHPMFKVGELLELTMIKVLQLSSIRDLENNSYKPRQKWIDEGIDCEILNLGAKSWKKGKVRINVIVEFCPDEPEEMEPESPLDSERKLINSLSETKFYS
jgi:hypothetical protein